jgi:hypothetical protein
VAVWREGDLDRSVRSALAGERSEDGGQDIVELRGFFRGHGLASFVCPAHWPQGRRAAPEGSNPEGACSHDPGVIGGVRSTYCSKAFEGVRKAVRTEFEAAQVSSFEAPEKRDDLIYGNFKFKGGHFARLSLSWADVEAAIASFAEKGHPDAVVLERAGQLASAIGDQVKNSD